MKEACKCPEKDEDKCSACLQSYCSNCHKRKLKEEFEEICNSQNLNCLQCSYKRIKMLVGLLNSSQDLKRTTRTRSLQIPDRVQRCETSEEINVLEMLNEDISEENRLIIFNQFLKKTDDFLLYFTTSFEKILSFKNKINKKFLSDDIKNSYTYFMNFISTSIDTFNVWKEEINTVEEILNQHNNKISTPKSNLRNAEDNCEKIDGHFQDSAENSVLDVNYESSNDSIYSQMTETISENMDCDITTDNIICTYNADHQKSALQSDHQSEKNVKEVLGAASESDSSFVFDIYGSNFLKHDEDVSNSTLLNGNEMKSKNGMFQIDPKAINCTDQSLSKQSIINQKIDFLNKLGLKSNEHVDCHDTESLKEYEMIRLLSNIEDEPFSMSEEETPSECFEEEEYIELDGGIYGKITHTLPNLPYDDPAGIIESCFDNYQNHNIKACSVILQKNSEIDLMVAKVNEKFGKGDNTSEEENETEGLKNTNNVTKKRKKSVSNSLSSKKMRRNSNHSISDISDIDLDSTDSEGDTNSLNLLDNVCTSVNNDETYGDVLENLLNTVCNDSCEEDSELWSQIDPEPEKDIITNANTTYKNNKNNESNSFLTVQEVPNENWSSDNNSDWRNDPLLHFTLNEKSSEPRSAAISSLKNPSAIPDDLKHKILKLEARILNKRPSDVSLENSKDNGNALDKHGENKSYNPSDEDSVDVEAKYNKIIINSDSDSDIEFIPTYKTDKPNTLNKSNDTEIRKGRRNIREILDDKALTQETQEAKSIERKRINRLLQKQKNMKTILSESQYFEEKNGLILDMNETTKSPNIIVHPILCEKLKSHQKEGIKFMWDSCYEGVKQIQNGYQGSGCILAHCMGLGKTIQVIGLIHTLFTYSVTNTKHVLIVCPLSLVLHWKMEFKKALENIKDNVFKLFCISGKSIALKKLEISKWRAGKGVLIMGYECYQRLIFAKRPLTLQDFQIIESLSDPGPDLIVLDEGHLIKNEDSVRSKSFRTLKTKRRIILTGTPLQNNLMEYYYMIQFIKPNLLGSVTEFKNCFANPITNGQYGDSTREDISKMKKRSFVLNKLLKGTVQRFEYLELVPYLKERHDYALYIQLHPIQANLYRRESELALKSAHRPDTNNLLLTNYYKFQLIWTHPYMIDLKKQQYTTGACEERNMSAKNEPYWWDGVCPPDSNSNINYGPKFKVMYNIITESEKLGDKVIVFSNSIIELNAIEHFLQQHSNRNSLWIPNEDYYRMDGGTPTEKRIQLCDKFNDKSNVRPRLFLVSNKVGGLGINLIGANRVILMDVNWNPAQDSQSVFRVYRFGQEKQCFIYRLVARGTMEQVIYERQVSKLAMAGRVVDDLHISSHFNSDELQILYRSTFEINEERKTVPLPPDAILANVYQNCTEIFKFHEHQSYFASLPGTNLNELEMKLAWDEFTREKEEEIKAKSKKNVGIVIPRSVDDIVEPQLPHLSTAAVIQQSTSNLNQNVGSCSKSNINLTKQQNPDRGIPAIKNNVNKKTRDIVKLTPNKNAIPSSSNLNKYSSLNDFEESIKYIRTLVTDKTNRHININDDENAKPCDVNTKSNKLIRRNASNSQPTNIKPRKKSRNGAIPTVDLIEDNADNKVDCDNAETNRGISNVPTQSDSNFAIVFNQIADAIINLDEVGDNLLINEQQKLISALNENLNITLSALDRSKPDETIKQASDNDGIIEID